MRENEWQVVDEAHDYLVATAGCGAIKIFVETEGSDYSIVFHSNGNLDSRERTGPAIGRYILQQSELPKAVNVLCLQPYDISSDVMDSVNEITSMVHQEGIPTDVQAVSLKNIEGEPYSQFVHLNLRGTADEILERYGDLRLQGPKLSSEERNKKIALFQSLPREVRTREFIRDWATLSLEEASQVAEANSQRTFWDYLFSS